MISQSMKRYMQLGVLVAYAACAYGLDSDDLYQSWRNDRAAQMVPELVDVAPVQRFDVKHDITEPLKDFVREEIKPQMDFLKSKIETKAPKIEQDRAQYGYLKRMNPYSREYKEWQEKAKQDFGYAMANPIVLDDYEVPHRKEQGLDFMAQNLYNESNRLYQEKKKLEAALQNTSLWDRIWNRSKTANLRNKLALVNLDLESVDYDIEELPMRKAHMRMRAQDVRQKRLQELEDVYANPEDRYINDEAFAGQMRKSVAQPDSSHLESARKRMQEVWTPKIQHKDQSGLEWLYGNYDDALQYAVMNKSDALREEAEKRYKPYQDENVLNKWLKELHSLENARRVCKGLPKSPYQNWYHQGQVEWEKEKQEENQRDLEAAKYWLDKLVEMKKKGIL